MQNKAETETHNALLNFSMWGNPWIKSILWHCVCVSLHWYLSAQKATQPMQTCLSAVLHKSNSMQLALKQERGSNRRVHNNRFVLMRI